MNEIGILKKRHEPEEIVSSTSKMPEYVGDSSFENLANTPTCRRVQVP